MKTPGNADAPAARPGGEPQSPTAQQPTAQQPSAHQPSARQRAWALETLELPANLPADGVARGLLQNLEAANCVPTPACEQAILLLAGRHEQALSQPAVRNALAQADEAALFSRVEQFARSFFQLDPAERSRQWIELMRLTAGKPRAALWVQSLMAGLNVQVETGDPQTRNTPADQDQSDVEQLKQAALRLFVLRPKDRAAVRAKISAELGRDAARFEKAAAQLRSGQPAIAALAPDLIEVWRTKAKRAKRQRRLQKKAGKLPVLVEHNKGRKGWLWVVGIMTALGVLNVVTKISRAPKGPKSDSPLSSRRFGEFRPPPTPPLTDLPPGLRATLGPKMEVEELWPAFETEDAHLSPHQQELLRQYKLHDVRRRYQESKDSIERRKILNETVASINAAFEKARAEHSKRRNSAAQEISSPVP